MGRTTLHIYLNLFFIILSFLSSYSQTFLDVDELSVQYGIEITNKPVILNSQPVDENVLHLSSKHGQLYSCFLPKLPEEQDQDSNAGDPVENVTDILDKSLNKTCLTHKKGWWTYKLCHKKSITQYHVSETGDVDSPITNLGSYSTEDDWSKEDVLERKPSEIFHSHTYVNGSVCDVTQQKRKTTVQYFCSSKLSNSIIRIEEPATCEYIFTVHSAKLCNHPLFFKKETKKSVHLLCSPALMEHEYNKYTEKMNKKKKVEEERLKKVLEKKKELDASGKNAESTGDGLSKIDLSSSKKDGKEMLNDIASFMKGFMNVLNIKSEDVKVSTKLYKDGKAIGNDKINLEELQSQLNKEIEDEIAGSNSKVKKNLLTNDNDKVKPKYIGKINKDSEDTPTDISIKKDKEKSKPETLKEFNSIADSMIKQLELDSIRMEKKSAKERELMLKEFHRVRQQAVNELGKSQRMLKVLESLKTDGKSEKTKNELQNQIIQVKGLIENLFVQIKYIDSKQKTVAELEKSTNKRLHDINKKIISTRTAHKVAKSLEKAPKGTKSEDYFDKVLKNIFSDDEEEKVDDKNKDALEKLVIDDSEKKTDKPKEKNKDGEETAFKNVFRLDEEKINANLKQSLEEIQKVASESEERIKSSIDLDSDMDLDGDGKDDPFDGFDDSSGTKKAFKLHNDKERSKLVSDMLKNLRSEIGKLKNDIENNKFVKGDKKKEIDKENGVDATKIEKEKDEEPKKGKGFDSLINILKEEVGKASENFKKENENASPDDNGDDEEKKMIEEGKQDAKKKIEVQVRSMDDASLDKELGKTLDETDDEEKEVSKKMEETVRKQLKDAGLDFGDKLKIKIITTKDKFDKFSSDGKDVKLLNNEDATDFKDLLLGFLGGGKEKVNEEQRQKTLEENYNFSLEDDEEENLRDNIL